jgi:hypothetical protein
MEADVVGLQIAAWDNVKINDAGYMELQPDLRTATLTKRKNNGLFILHLEWGYVCPQYFTCWCFAWTLYNAEQLLLVHCLQTNKIHPTFVFYYSFINPYICFGLYKVIFRGFINYVHFTTNVLSAIIISPIYLYMKYIYLQYTVYI